jgi:glycosyltransferase involved in cell wall biosynthesis
MPKIDIFLPCYNSSSTLPQTIKSIYSQTFKNFRVVLVDNNSTDNSVEIFRSLGDDRFKYKCHTETVSLGENFNRCLQYVASDYYCIMHTDDEYLPNYLEEMLSEMENYPCADFSFCNVNIIDKNSKKKISIKNIFKNHSSSLEKEYYGCDGLDWISEYNKIITPSIMYRRTDFTVNSKFSCELKFVLDWDYYFRALKEGKRFLHVNKTLFNYRIHEKQQTFSLKASMTKYYEMRALLNAMHDYREEVFSRFPKDRYKYLRYTIISDIFCDIITIRFVYAMQKFRFLFNLIQWRKDLRQKL